MQKSKWKALILLLTLLLVPCAVLASGQILWISSAAGGAIKSSPVVDKATVYVSSEDGAVYAFDADTGALVWSTIIGVPLDSSPAITKDVLYIGSDDGILYAIVTK